MRGTLHPTHKMIITSRIDRIALTAGILEPLTTLPQIFLTYSSHSAAEVSIITWVGFDLGSIVFLTYGIRHRLWPLIFAQSLWLVVQTSMIVVYFTLPH